MSKLSIVIPVYYNEGNLLPLYESIKKEIIPYIDEYEIVMVDDGSKDHSWDIMKTIAALDENVRLIKLVRNFGAPVATYAGFSAATGDCIVIKAADLQEPASLIVDMYKKWQEGNKVVIAARAGREENAVKKMCANLYYKIMSKIAFPNMPKMGFDIYLMDRSVMEIMRKIDEKNSTLRLQLLWAGYTPAVVTYVRQKRKIGKSRWTLSKKIKLAMDSILGFSDFPIKVILALGGIITSVSLLWGIILVILRCIGFSIGIGYVTLVLFLMGIGVVLIADGIVGEYMYRVLDETRKRPVYIVEEEIDQRENERCI